MSDNILEFPSKPEEPEDFLIGPFEECRVVIEGRKIPKLTGHRTTDGVNLIIDNRFCVLVPNDLAQDIAWLVAQAMAVGAGYPHLGAETKDRCFAPLCMQVGNVTTEAT